ncbi:lytic transglycosylase domain-containing protein [Edaphobacter sp.]|uniref:lytic transglycosylase domain-containing protein n=1 Tax=Edaphobacter sp. TaxID=1934404 RepID=UPI002DBC4061|nr:lytic transglycosylase domain-containing protein [Edaphobacter sp.]HEU5340329.1 lytic transglycosylase domain-containing protein [Edaphobacter sp.]
MRANAAWLGVLAIMVCPLAGAMEHVTLKNGFAVDCVRREAVGGRVRLYLNSAQNDANYLEVAAGDVVRVETMPDPPRPVAASTPVAVKNAPPSVALTRTEMREMLAHAGAAHDIDKDLLASVVRAESGGQVRAVSRTGARGLMQLMPATANTLGVKDSFRPDENIAGGTAYLDELLTRYHDNVALALAAYNAGPGAVDKYHGVPPYHETRAYVARVIREFNRRKRMAVAARGQ